MLKRLGALPGLGLFGGAVAAACIAMALTLPADLTGEPRLMLQQGLWFVAILALAGAFGLWKLTQFIYEQPLKRLAVEVRAATLSDQAMTLDAGRYAALPALPEAVGELSRKMAAVRAQINEAVAAATGSAEQEKARLGAILNDLHEGVVVCNMKHQIVLYNQNALDQLHVSGELGLGRSLFALVDREPVQHMLDILVHRPSDHQLDNAPVVAGTMDGRSLLQGRLSLVRTQNEVTGYVLTFNDVTDQVSALARRDALLRDLLESVGGLTRQHRSDGSSVETLADALNTVLEKGRKSYRSLLTGWWPMTDIHSIDLFNFVIRRLDSSALKVNMTGLPVWLHGDSHSLVFAVEALLRAIAKSAQVEELDLFADSEGGHGWICISWTGGRVDDATLIDWQKSKVSQALGGMTVLDVMRHHTREDLIEEERDGRVTLRIALSLGREGQDVVKTDSKLPPRPEFFDFNLLRQGQDSDQGKIRLRDLTYVVFDTETTGLSPNQGDQIVSIAGVRIVNGRILTGESFNRIVNPGRSIPPESTKFHGLTDEMVADRPPIAVVLPQFKTYAADAVLVAHNAAFDMKFLRMREAECHVRFDNPVLDTMLLSSYVDGSSENQSLDAIADRYGFTITDRHTALGDSLVTAAVLLRLIDGLEAKGIHTLDDAMTTLNMTMELHNRAQAFN